MNIAETRRQYAVEATRPHAMHPILLAAVNAALTIAEVSDDIGPVTGLDDFPGLGMTVADIDAQLARGGDHPLVTAAKEALDSARSAG